MFPAHCSVTGRRVPWDFFVIGHLGDATLHLIWENVTANQYLLTPVYPMYGSNIRFGVAWEFMD